jgi:uncharacterized protein (UPF0248 family)
MNDKKNIISEIENSFHKYMSIPDNVYEKLDWSSYNFNKKELKEYLLKSFKSFKNINISNNDFEIKKEEKYIKYFNLKLFVTINGIKAFDILFYFKDISKDCFLRFFKKEQSNDLIEYILKEYCKNIFEKIMILYEYKEEDFVIEIKEFSSNNMFFKNPYEKIFEYFISIEDEENNCSNIFYIDITNMVSFFKRNHVLSINEKKVLIEENNDDIYKKDEIKTNDSVFCISFISNQNIKINIKKEVFFKNIKNIELFLDSLKENFIFEIKLD